MRPIPLWISSATNIARNSGQVCRRRRARRGLTRAAASARSAPERPAEANHVSSAWTAATAIHMIRAASHDRRSIDMFVARRTRNTITGPITTATTASWPL